MTGSGDGIQAFIQAGTAATPNLNNASAISVAGPATATADTNNQVASLNSTLDISIAGTISVSEVSATLATATNVGGAGFDSTATAEYLVNTGGIIDTTATSSGDIQIGADAQINVQVDNTTTAAATSTAGDASGKASMAGSYGLLDTDITAGASSSIFSNLDANAIATATTVGTIAGPGDAIAEASFSGDTAAIYSTTINPTTKVGQGDIRLGNNGSVIGLAGDNADPLSLNATAATNTGNALATVSTDIIAGIGAGGAAVPFGETNISIGNSGVITAEAFITAASSASTVTAAGTAATLTEAAKATTTIDQLAALGSGVGLGLVTTGSDATITAVASSISNAAAASSDGSGTDTIAIVDNNQLTGVTLGDLVAGNNASLSVNASSTQTASASTVAATGGAALDEATAQVAETDLIFGIYQTEVSINNNANRFSVTASLAGTATSKNVNGAASNSAAGLDSDVFGIRYGSINVGNSLTSGSDLRVDATSNLTATAFGVEGTANSNAGGNGTPGVMSEVIGLNSLNDFAIGNSGTITSVAGSKVGATAITTAGDANAYAGQIGNAIFETPITIGNDGSISAQTTLVGNAAATTVGSATTAADSTANLVLTAVGIAQPTVAISIGDTGNVSGNAFASGGAVAQTTAGSATAMGDVGSAGIALGNGTPVSTATINISGFGNVSGIGVIGTLGSSGGISSPVLVSASAVSDDATATGVFNGSGITGFDDMYENQITAGAKGGDITGQALAAGTVMASTIGTGSGNDASATIQPSTIFGISDVDLIGGQVGSNLIKGLANGAFNATATSVAGDALGSSDNKAYGIFGGSIGAADTINLNGNVTSIAQLANTVVASTVACNAGSAADSTSLGLANYDVTIISSGSFNASAMNITKSTASSVAGNVSA
ncbi:MAG: hypothetical protein NTY67_12470 [Cyanobacteria bacterium]|nr:hypothetical protein [Cyanobacteriota bacterium]